MEIFLALGIAFRALIMTVGIPGNILIVLVYARKRPKSSTDVYILALGVADLYVCLLMPLKIYSSYNQENYTNADLCKLTHYCSLIGTFLSMFLTICITVDRYFAVCRPLKRFVTPSRARITVVVCLLLAAAVGSVALFSAGIRRYGSVSMCSIDAAHANIIYKYSFLTLGMYCVSLIFIIFVYTAIYKTLRNKARTFRVWSLRYSDTKLDESGRKKVRILDKRGSITKMTGSRDSRKIIPHVAFKDHRIKPQVTRVAWKSEEIISDPHASGHPGGMNEDASTSSHEQPHRTVKTMTSNTTHSFMLSGDRNKEKLSSDTQSSPISPIPEQVISTIYRSTRDRVPFHPPFLVAANTHINKYRERIKANNKISKMIFLITVIYFVTWVPLMVFQCFPTWLIMALFQNKAGFTIVYLLTLALNVNHAINPIVYSFVNVRFRRECKATSAWMKRAWPGKQTFLGATCGPRG
ncbi:muscarinic acetylcholine receptor M1-like [Strongylocentrotus purpuratus]|uniref:G-protein coupled receptors family 1 profile domain-containing protein n=1 Tax=Strongylocentrotus purpuratus TaxID=7668 RepID=A0A7M7PRU0_STRPU|nr:muscarinic acetylcholine receptor M1-like [Strongylocentrotus purpuratus]|eukprot:XP_011679791.1 PREDICTED: muscarinic acetylcholine receptor M1-like [Strongylocentrotus purpuratus]